MSRIGSSPSELSVVPLDSEPAAAPPRPSSRQSTSQVESWVPQQRPLDFNGPEFKAASEIGARSGPDLAAQAAKETEERITDMKVLTRLGGPLSQLAAKHAEPLGKNPFGSKEVALSAFGDTLREPALVRAFSRLSPSDVRVAVQEQVRLAWPRQSPAEVVKIRQYLMEQLTENLRENTAPRLQSLATRMLSDTARSFDSAASDPNGIAKMSARLNEMAHPLADPADQAAVRDLRAGFGLSPDDSRVTPEKLGEALKERAKVLHEEADKMKNHARPTLFRALAEQDVGSSFKQAAGIREGSLLAAQIDAVKAEGESGQTAIGAAKFMSVVAGAAATGGMGLGVLAGASISSALAAPSLVHAWEGVGSAQAGESAGTMKAGAAEEANRKAIIETAGAVVSVAGAAGIGQALHHSVSHLAESVAVPELVHAVSHAAIEGTTEYATEPIGEKFSEALASEGEPSGRNVFERMQP